MFSTAYDMVIIGGSAGSLETILQLVQALPEDFPVPIVLVIHRMKNTNSHLTEMLSRRISETHANAKGLRVTEPEDKQQILAGAIYLAPQNYHLLAENDHTFSLDYSEPVNYSRPSIDVSFESFAGLYQSGLLAVLLSGANSDGARGLRTVIAQKGTALVQSPDTSSYPAMPVSAIEQNPGVRILKPEEIVHCIINPPQKPIY